MSVDSACVRILEAAAQVEGAAWLEGGSRACDQYPGEDDSFVRNIFRTRCMLFYFVKTIGFVS